MAEGTTTNGKHVSIYYSGKAQPEYPDHLRKCLQFCTDQGITIEVVDVDDDPDAAPDDILTLPAIITKNGDRVTRHIGVVTGVKKLICEDFGLSKDEQ